MFTHIRLAHLPVFDQDRALGFYRDVLGLAVVRDEPFKDGLRWIELAVGDARTHLWFAARADDRPADEPALILVTDDLDAAYERLVASGVAFASTPASAPWSPGERFALCRDSEGNMIMLSQTRG